MPTHTHLVFDSSIDLPSEAETIALIGRKAELAVSAWPERLGIDAASFESMLSRCSPGDGGASTTTWSGSTKVVVGVLPEVCSRYNSPSRAWAIPGLCRRVGGSKPGLILLHLSEPDHLVASVLAVCRSFPLFTRKTGKTSERQVTIRAEHEGKTLNSDSIQPMMDGVRTAARLVDAPASLLHTSAYVAEAREMAERVGATCEVIEGDALEDGGFGGFIGVGQAAVHGPAMVILRHEPEGATRSVAWVGKGIVYDTGGLSIKGKTGMPGMKGDMGGSAAVFGAFEAAARIGVDFKITAVLCLAENAVGPEATRPDDILVMHSGKTVEVNNTDAEGRLVLADGVHWVATETDADLIIDIATLTGAAPVATGKVHSAIVCSDEEVETAVVLAGRQVGEPCHQLLYAPELFRKEFRSQVADMKNSVKARNNAQSSCAAQFVANHLPDDHPRWLHVDMAGPSWGAEGRGSGYGVGLLLALGAGPSPS
jgi:probable aminopeptidase NPEPL1